ncbi:MAG: phosphotransferase [Actinomycetota bacterium]|nr:phosphotransferase [Actinomycetota bacterium]
MVDRPEAGAIAAAFASREGRLLALSILGTADEVRIVGDLHSFCTARLGSGVKGDFFCELSVGAAFGLRLYDDRRVLLKVHPPDRTSPFLETVYRVQRHLYAREFPCPEPICGPLPFARGLATVEVFVDEGEFADAHEPEIRREMTRALARMIELSAEVSDVEELSRGWKLPPDWGLWPVPHNALFDFEATAVGAEWIDEIAGKAKKILDESPGRMVVGHADWSAKHFRFKDGATCMIYDWDSIRLDRETSLVGHTAYHFPYTEYFDVPRRASLEEARLFVEEYETARGTPFSEPERAAVSAAATYGLAYTARWEHALDIAGENLRGSFREALRRYGEEYPCV